MIFHISVPSVIHVLVYFKVLTIIKDNPYNNYKQKSAYNECFF
jgi:hypothetical protein